MIEIAVNPEARLSARVTGMVPAALPCGREAEFHARIVNLGFVTAPILVQVTGVTRADVSVAIDGTPLSGRREEYRSLYVRLSRSGPTDVTLTFTLPGEKPDLGGRGRIHLLLDCR